MKNKFQHYLSPDIELVNKIWNDAFFIFDTNVLLNFYRYSDDTVTELWGILNKLKERIWLPYQVVEEFHKKRLIVINQQIKIYSDTIIEVNKLKNSFSNTRNPFLSGMLYSEMLTHFGKITQELNDKMDKFDNYLIEDKMIENIINTFEDSIGDSFNQQKLHELYAIADSRIGNKIPPGYCDGSKSSNKYGDFIIWMQILEKAKYENCSVIFITDDNKEDFWLYSGNKKIGPRPELRKEFNDYTGNNFYMYNPILFLKIAIEKSLFDINKTSLEEIEKLTSLDTIDRNEKESIIITTQISWVSKKPKIKAFLKQIELNGYDFKTETQEDNKLKIFLSIPNIPDLQRRIHNMLEESAKEFGFKFVKFDPQ